MPAATVPKTGDKAPTFTLPALPDGKPVKLADFKGRKVILYFYPKDMTPAARPRRATSATPTRRSQAATPSY